MNSRSGPKENDNINGLFRPVNGVQQNVCDSCKRSRDSRQIERSIADQDSGSTENLEGDHNELSHVISNSTNCPPGSWFNYYKKFGFYWNYFPKTDYTYLPSSRYYKKEIAPGVPVVPNLSRPPIHPRNSIGDHSFSSSYNASYEDETPKRTLSAIHRPIRWETQNRGAIKTVLNHVYTFIQSQVTSFTTTTTTTVVDREESASPVCDLAMSGLSNDRMAGKTAMQASSGRRRSRKDASVEANISSDNDTNVDGVSFNSFDERNFIGVKSSQETFMERRVNHAGSAHFLSTLARRCSYCLFPLLFLLIAILLATLWMYPPDKSNSLEDSGEPLWNVSNWWPSWLTFTYWLTLFGHVTNHQGTNSVNELPDIHPSLVKLYREIGELKDKLSDQDVLTKIKIHTLEHQLSELKSKLSEVESAKANQPAVRLDSGYVGELLANHKQLTSVIDAALSKYHADQIALPDYALQTSGGEVVSLRCTVVHVVHSAYYSIMGIPLAAKTPSPDIILTPGTMPGDCLPFEGQVGNIVIRLSARIKVTAFTIDHAPKEILPEGSMASAPKDFAVHGLKTVNDANKIILGKFQFDKDGNSYQHFIANNVDDSFELIELEILSNHGHIRYTCLYRFRVHGIPVDAPEGNEIL